MVTLAFAVTVSRWLDPPVSDWVSVPAIFLGLMGVLELATFSPWGKRGRRRRLRDSDGT